MATETKADAKIPPTPVSANPVLVEFPTDIWGFTSEVKKAIFKAASGIRGQKDKHDLLLLTLGTLAKHIIARYEKDKADAEKLRLENIAAEEARNKSLWAAMGYTSKPKD